MFYIANWKCNLTTQLIQNFLDEFLNCKLDARNHIIIAPPTPYLSTVNLRSPRNFQIAAQDITHLDTSSATGEISANMLKDLGVEYVIIGHSERRRYFDESAPVLSKKLQNAVSASIVPIFCVGELDVDAGSDSESHFKDELKFQLDAAANLLNHQQFLIAYEPAWAVGTGINADADRIGAVIEFLHSHLGSQVTVLYGGSVNSSNVGALKRVDGIGGFLIGGASLNARSFEQIISSTE